MAAPSTGRRRPSRRRGGLLGSPRSARNGSTAHPSPPLPLHRLPGARRRQGRGARLVVSAPDAARPRAAEQADRPAGAPWLDRRQERRRAGRGQAAADRVRDAVSARRPGGRGGRAVRRPANQPSPRASRRGEGPRGQGERVRLRGAQGRPGPRQGCAALDLPGVGSYAEEKRTYPLKGTAAQVIGFAGTDNQGSPASSCSSTRSSRARPAARRSSATRPATPSRPSRTSSRCRARTSGSPSIARSSTPPRTSSRRRCAGPAASRRQPS